MRGWWLTALAGSTAALLAASCADVATFSRATSLGLPGATTAADQANARKGSAEHAGDTFILVPRAPGQPLDKIRSGGTEAAAGDSGPSSAGGAAPSADTITPAPGASAAPVYASPDSPCEQTAAVGLFAASDRPVLATGKGVYVRSADSWQRIADAFPCGTVPAAIAPAGTAWFAAAADGIYRAGGQSLTWTPVASGTAVVDLDITPDASFGVAVQEDGRPFTFDGATWTRQSYRFLSPIGGVRTVSATESYVVGQNLLYRGDARNTEWTLLAQPDAANPVAGLAVRRPSGNAASLVVTTRAGLYRYSSAGWVAELGPDSALYLGLPAFSGGAGFVSDLGTAGGAAYVFSAATWQAAPVPPAPLDTTALLPDGDTLALAIDGESVYLLSGGSWQSVALP